MKMDAFCGWVLKKLNIKEEAYLENYAKSYNKDFTCDMEHVVFLAIMYFIDIYGGYYWAKLNVVIVVIETLVALSVTLLGLYTIKHRYVWLGHFYIMVFLVCGSIISFINACFGMSIYCKPALGYILIYSLSLALLIYLLLKRTQNNIRNNKYKNKDLKNLGKTEFCVLVVSITMVAMYIQNSEVLTEKSKLCLACLLLVSLLGTTGFPGIVKACCIKKYYPNKKFF